MKTYLRNLSVMLLLLMALPLLAQHTPTFTYRGTDYVSGSQIALNSIDEDPATDPSFWLIVYDNDDDLTFTWNANVTNGTANVNVTESGRSTSEARLVTIEPGSNFYGQIEFTVAVTGRDPGNNIVTQGNLDFTLGINPVNDSPYFENLTNRQVLEGANFAAFTLADYARDVEDTNGAADAVPLALTYAYQATGDLGVSINAATSEVTITIPNAEWYGSEVVTFTITDSEGASTSLDVTFTVTNVNDAPVIDFSVFAGDTFAFDEDGSLLVDFSDAITDIDSEYGAEQLTLSVTSVGNVGISAAANQSPDNITGSFVNAVENANGTENVTVRVTDSGGLWDEGVLEVTINPVNDLPVISISNQTDTQPANFTLINLNASVSDVEDTDPNDLIWTFSGNDELILNYDNGLRTLDVQKPNVNWIGSETITFTVTDTDGGESNADVTFTIEENTLEDITFFYQQSEEYQTGQTITLDPVAEDGANSQFWMIVEENASVPPTQSFDWSITPTVSGEVLAADIAITEAPVRVNEPKYIIVNPHDNFTGTLEMTLTVTGRNNDLNQEVSRGYVFLTLEVTPTNDAPVVADIPGQSIPEGTAFATIALDQYVEDIDNADSEIIWTVQNAGALDITISANRVATVVPSDENWNGSQTVTFVATDPEGEFDSDDATFTWTAIADAPEFSEIPEQVLTYNTAMQFPVIDLDTYLFDPDSAPNQIGLIASGNTELGVNIDANHELTVTLPNQTWYGSETITITATDQTNLEDTVDILFRINRAPVVDDIADQNINEGEDFAVINLNSHATDAETPADLSWSITGNTELTAVINQFGIATISAPAADWTGSEQLTFTVSDPDGASDSDTATFTVTAVNDAPTFVNFNPALNVVYDNPYSYSMTAQDNEGDPIVITAETRPAWLSFVDNGGGNATISGTPGFALVGSYPVVLRAADANDPAVFTEQSFTINVLDDNLPPVIDLTGLVVSFDEDTTYEVDFTPYISDPNDDLLMVSVAGNQNILATYPSNRVVVFSATENWFGDEQVRIRVNDGRLPNSRVFEEALLTVTVVPVADPPEFTSEPVYNVNYNQPYNYNIAAFDPDGGDVVISGTVVPAFLNFIDNGNGTALLAGSAAITDLGNHLVEITATDDDNEVTTQQFNLNVTDSNIPPVVDLTGLNITFAEGSNSGVIDFEPYIIDGDNDPITISIAGNTNLNVEINGLTAVFTPIEEQYFGVETLRLRADDGQPSHARVYEEALFDVTVTPVADNPEFTSLPTVFATFDEEWRYDISVIDYDGDNILIVAETIPSWLTFETTGFATATLYGTPTLAEEGNHTVDLRAVDSGDGTALQHFVIQVSGNHPPTLDLTGLDISFTSNESQVVDFSSRVSDADNDQLTLHVAANPNISATINEMEIEFTNIVSEWHGTQQISISVADDNGASATETIDVEVIRINHLPQFTSAAVTQAVIEQEYSYNIIVTDSDGDDITIDATTLPAWLNFTDNTDGTASLVGTPQLDQIGSYPVVLTATDSFGGVTTQSFNVEVISDGIPRPTIDLTGASLTFNEDQTVEFDFTPYIQYAGTHQLVLSLSNNTNINAEFAGLIATFSATEEWSGTETVLITVDDGVVSRYTDSDNFTIVVNDINDTPIFTSIPLEFATSGIEYRYTVQAYDPDGPTVSFQPVVMPAWLTLTDNGDGTALLVGTPANEHQGANQTAIFANPADGGLVGETQSFSIFVSPVNHIPTIDLTGIVVNFDEDSQQTINLADAVHDDDPGDQLTLFVQSNEYITAVVNNFEITFTAAPDYNGVSQVVVSVDDGVAGRAYTGEPLTVTVNPVDDNPLFRSIPNLFVNSGEEYTYLVRAYDPDGTDVSLSYAGPNWLHFSTDVAGNGRLAGTPNDTMLGEHTITLNATDGNGGTNQQIYTLTVLGSTVARPRINLANASLTFVENGTADFDFTDYITYNGTEPLILILGQNTNINAVFNGLVGTFSAATDWNGIEEVLITVDDGVSARYTASDWLRVRVTGVNDAPVFTSTPVDSVVYGEPYEYIARATDPEGRRVQIIANVLPNWLELDQYGSGVSIIHGTPALADAGLNNVTLTAQDEDGQIAQQIFQIMVKDNHTPTVDLTGLDVTFDEDDTQTVDFSTYVNDADGDDLTLSFGGLTNTQAAVTGLSVVFSADQDWSGSENATITVTDPDGETADATFTVTVNAVNDNPTITPTSTVVSFNEDESTTVDYSSDIEDVDGDTVTFAATNSEHIQAAVNGFEVTYTAAANWNGTETITLTVTDPSSTTGSADITVTVNAVADDPIFTSTPVTTAVFDELYTYDVAASDPEGGIVTLGTTAVPSWLTFTSTGNGTGTLTGTPTAGDENELNDVVIDANDDNGGITQQKFVITISGNHPPTIDFAGATVNFDEDTNTTFDLTTYVNDADGDDLTVSVSGLTNIIAQVNGMELQLSAAADWSGSETATITVSDGELTDSDQLPITVNPLNDDLAIDFGTFVAEFDEDTELNVDLSLYVDLVDGATHTYQITGNQHVSYQVEGNTLTLGADENWNGNETLNVQATATYTSGAFDTANADLPVNVNAVNDAPVFTSEPLTFVSIGEHYLYNIMVTDIENDTITLAQTGLPAWLTLTDNGDGTGTLAGTPADADTGNHALTISANDQTDEVTQVFTITVAGNHAPEFVDIENLDINFDEDTTMQLDMEEWVNDADGDDLTIAVAGNTNISVDINPDQPLVINFGSAVANWNGAETLTFTLSDGFEQTTRTLAMVNKDVTVNPVNDAPTVASPLDPVSYLASQGSHAVTQNLNAVFDDVDDSSLSFSSQSIDELQVAIVDGAITLTNVNSWYGPANVVITATDSGDLSVSDTLVVMVENDIDEPTIADVADQRIERVNEPWTMQGTVTGYPRITLTGDQPAGLTITPNGNQYDLNWTPTLAQVGTYNLEVTATNPWLNVSVNTQFVLKVYNLNDAPTNLATRQLLTTPINLSWNAPQRTNWLNGYTLYEGTSIGSGFSPVDSLISDAATVNWSHSPAVGSVHYYKLAARLQDGDYQADSDLSNVIQVYPMLDFESVMAYDDTTGTVAPMGYNVPASTNAAVNFKVADRYNGQRMLTKVLVYLSQVPAGPLQLNVHQHGDNPGNDPIALPAYSASSLSVGWNIFSIPTDIQPEITGDNFFVEVVTTTTPIDLGLSFVVNGPRNSISNNGTGWQTIAGGELMVRAILSPVVYMALDQETTADNPMNFGNVSVDKESAPQAVTVYNYSPVDINITSIVAPIGYKLRLDGSSSWVNAITSFEIKLNSTKIFWVKFVPKSQGVHSSVVSMATDVDGFNSFSLYVRGTGVNGMPNAFTPNGDGLNDEFTINLSDWSASPLKLLIFNRSGRKLREINGRSDMEIKWNGIDDDGDECVGDVYLYVLKKNNDIIKRGKIYLVR